MRKAKLRAQHHPFLSIRSYQTNECVSIREVRQDELGASVTELLLTAFASGNSDNAHAMSLCAFNVCRSVSDKHGLSWISSGPGERETN
ncbi:hypothetical protein M877_06120 [Streptomyces niveus NCIMB 11891]|nr:hypothetical protein M877_06120 [Streptomyces niveus NCIMB 11891]